MVLVTRVPFSVPGFSSFVFPSIFVMRELMNIWISFTDLCFESWLIRLGKFGIFSPGGHFFQDKKEVAEAKNTNFNIFTLPSNGNYFCFVHNDLSYLFIYFCESYTECVISPPIPRSFQGEA